MTDLDERKSQIEAILFLSGDGLTISDLILAFPESDRDEIRMLLDTLVDDYLERDGGILLTEVAGKYRFTTHQRVYPVVRTFLQEKKRETLSKAMMEVLAIIAYRQPVTVAEIEEIRGASSRSLVLSLQNRKLIKSAGNKEGPGRPQMYATTRDFLEHFSLNQLSELPPPREVKELNFEELV